MRLLRVNGNSMFPALKHHNLCIYRSVKSIDDIIFGDIIVFKVMGKVMIKRVVGLPNQLIELSNGKLRVDGNHVEEVYLDKRFIDDIEYQWKPGIDELVVLGDNGVDSQDSRYYSSINFENVIGKYVFKLW